MDINLYPKEIERIFNLKLNRNQLIEIKRLIYEIFKNSGTDFVTIVERINHELKNKKPEGKDKFRHIKKILVQLRFPISSPKINIDTRCLFLNELKLPSQNTYHPRKEFIPEKIIIENGAKNSYLEQNVRNKFPDASIEYIDYCSQFRKAFKLTPYNLKKPLLFIAKERWDFIKKCPCTKKHIGCGYWIFNLGFGCPYDCSYCYLQQYQNFPGIILPSNLDDFFKKFTSFFKKIDTPIRIGTGEFCDSLALDDITSYSEKLIGFFSDKPVLFELKTKSNKVENILATKPAKNIILSWSLNPQEIIESEEYGVASLEERLEAAKKVQKSGYNIAFHFDPIIYFKDWHKAYKNLVDALYRLKPPFSWISLGTLRCNRALKPFVEQRLTKSKIMYGELFIGQDKKLRYPEFLRIHIYKNMIQWIKRYDKKTPIYLCMESENIWKNSLIPVSASKEVERFLIKYNA